MAWVDPDYAEEFAVVSAWLAALVPWSATYHSMPERASLLVAARFPVAEFQMRGTDIVVDGEQIAAESILAQLLPGMHVAGDLYVTTPATAAGFYTDGALVWGSYLWTAGAVLVALAVALSVGLYRESDALSVLPVDPVRAMGGLLATTALALGVASVLYFQARETVGIPVPVGVVLAGVLAAVLLRIERS